MSFPPPIAGFMHFFVRLTLSKQKYLKKSYMFLRKMTLKNTGEGGKIFHGNQNIPQLHCRDAVYLSRKYLQGKDQT